MSQYGTCITSPFWCLEFGCGALSFGKFAHPWLRTSDLSHVERLLKFCRDAFGIVVKLGLPKNRRFLITAQFNFRRIMYDGSVCFCMCVAFLGFVSEATVYSYCTGL